MSTEVPASETPYWAMIASSEMMLLLGSHMPDESAHMSIKVIVPHHSVGILVTTSRPEIHRRELTVVADPHNDDVSEWLKRTVALPSEVRGEFVHDVESSAVTAHRAKRNSGPLTIHRPRLAEQQYFGLIARHICRDSAHAAELTKLLKGAVQTLVEGGGQLQQSAVRRQLEELGIQLEMPRPLEPHLSVDVLMRSASMCCVCRRSSNSVGVHLVNGLSSDHDPDNLAAVCDPCWTQHCDRMREQPTVTVLELARHRQEWDWKVARSRREPAVRRVGQRMVLRDVLRRHLTGDFHWDGPRRGEFARLGGRMEDRFYQPNRGERLTARPAYYHTYWGLIGSRIVLPELYPQHADAAADAVADRLRATGWVTVDLEDYSADPGLGRRRVQTIRHTARAAMILFLTGRHLDVAAEVAWNILNEADSSIKSDGGWGEFRNEPAAPSTLYSSMYCLQLLSSACLDPNWVGVIPELPDFIAGAAGVLERTWRFMAGRWHADQWSMNGMPWIVNTAAILADVGAYAPTPLADELYAAIREQLHPTGRLMDRNVGAEWDAPEPVLGVRVAFAAAQLGCAADDERLARLRHRLLALDWSDAPLRTMDVAFLCVLSDKQDGSGRMPVDFTQDNVDKLINRTDRIMNPSPAPRPARVFVSYVREDHTEVDRLVAALRAEGIEVWLDRDSIQVGARWKDAVRQAIRDGDHFLAVFSANTAARQRTYMNEELLVAIEELRLRPRHRAWFLPVTLGRSPLPEIPIGPAETLHDIQQVDLENWSQAVAKLVTAIMKPS